jgi:hypothetical protein
MKRPPKTRRKRSAEKYEKGVSLKKKGIRQKKKKYTDDGTLETLDSIDREKQLAPLESHINHCWDWVQPHHLHPGQISSGRREDEQVNPMAPIYELESTTLMVTLTLLVMESLGGPSLS